MKNILLLTDFSENAKNAIIYATKLYVKQEVNFILFNAFRSSKDDIVTKLAGRGLNDLLSNETDSKLQSLIDSIKISNHNELHTFNYKSKFGNLIELVNQFIEKHSIDLVVLGAKGISAIEKIVFGSSTYALIKDVNCTALVVPANQSFPIPTKIAIASEFETRLNAMLFAELKQIVKDLNLILSVVYVNNEDNHPTKDMIQYSASIAVNMELNKVETYHYKHEDVVEGTNQFVKKHAIDMLVLINKKRNFLQNLFHISYTKQLAFNAQVPFMVLCD